MQVFIVVTRPDGSPIQGAKVEIISTATGFRQGAVLTTDNGGQCIGEATGAFFVRPRVTGDRHRVMVTAFGSAPVAGVNPSLTNEPYLTIGNPTTLSNERAFTAGIALSAVDGGANGLYTLNHAQVATGDLHTEYVLEASASWIDLTDGGDTALHLHNIYIHPDLATHDALGLATDAELATHAAGAGHPAHNLVSASHDGEQDYTNTLGLLRANAIDYALYSDAGVTQKGFWDGATGHIGIPTLSGSQIIAIIKTLASGNARGFDLDLTSSTASAGGIIAGLNFSIIGPSSGNQGNIWGINGTIVHASSGTLAALLGLRVAMQSSGAGAITLAAALDIVAASWGGDVPATTYLLRGSDQGGAGATAYGLYVPAQTGTVARSFIEDPLALGADVEPPASEKLVITGNACIKTNGVWRFYDTDNSNYVGLRSPAVAPAANLVVHLPSDTPVAGEFLKVTAITAPDVTTEWAAAGGGAPTSLLSAVGTQNLTVVGDTIVATDGTPVIPITLGSSLTLTSTPTIANGREGQLAVIINIDSTDTLTLRDATSAAAASNLKLGAATRALQPGGSIELVYNSAAGGWIEQSFINVIQSSVSSFTVYGASSSNREVANTGTDTAPNFVMAYVGSPAAPTTIDLDSGEVNAADYPATVSTPFTSLTGPVFNKGVSVGTVRTFTVSSVVSGTTKTRTCTTTYINRRYFGPHTQATLLSSAQVLTLDDTADGTSGLSTVYTGSFALVIDTNEYAWFAYRDAIAGTPVFTVNGFPGGFTNMGTISHTNDSGFVETFRLWRSDNHSLGSITVAVT